MVHWGVISLEENIYGVVFLHVSTFPPGGRYSFFLISFFPVSLVYSLISFSSLWNPAADWKKKICKIIRAFFSVPASRRRAYLPWYCSAAEGERSKLHSSTFS